MICKFCNSLLVDVLHKNHPGYKEGMKFEIYACEECHTSFIAAKNFNKNLYDLIYPKNNSSDGYYGSHAERVNFAKSTNPLKELLYYSHTYYPLNKYLENKKSLNILEIGCGYGYLTHALNKSGFTSFGVDVSENAIKFAIKNFGNYFKRVNDISDLLSLKNIDKFDLIVATEVIEHVRNPKEFVENCFKLLKTDGRLILTTPNKDYFPSASVWPTDFPPIHLFLFSKKSFEILAEKINLNVDFYNFANNISFYEKENKLLNYFLSRRKQKLSTSIFDKKGNLMPTKGKPLFKKTARLLLIDSAAVRFLCNSLYKVFFRNLKHSPTLGIIFYKN